MNRLDEHTLAAFLAGQLGPRARKRVARLLAEDEEAMEVILAAYELMEAGDGRALSEPQLSVVPTPQPQAPRAGPRWEVGFWPLTAILMALMATIAVALLVGASRELGANDWVPIVVEHESALGTSLWAPVDGAARYRVTISDPVAGEVYASRFTTDSRIPPDLLEQVPAGAGRVAVRLEAVSPDEAILGISRWTAQAP